MVELGNQSQNQSHQEGLVTKPAASDPVSSTSARPTDHGTSSGGIDQDDGRHSDDEPAPRQPQRPIRKLDEHVVNRIAAGEIIHRPANALKELIENSLDAGADMIQITLKEGGLKSLQIRDNGSGVSSTDLPLLCQRFATSKLREFDDLTRMTTFGFRGEALASISFVSASMSVVTKTRNDPLAYRAYYAAGELAPPKHGQTSEPKPCAGTDGTTITAEDLFFNVPQRRRALKSAAEEYNRCLDVAAKYALHYGAKGVGFVCKKAGSNATDLSTPSSPTTKTIDTIRLLHGTSVARELIHFHPAKDDHLDFEVEGWISGANWSAKRTTFLCFINNRLVDCPALKRSFETLYSALLPKGGHPWVYLSLQLEPSKVDVNVHPTKREVHFLDEEEVVEAVCARAQEALAGANTSRTFQFTQTLLPGATPAPPAASIPGEASSSTQQRPTSKASQNPQYQVRVDARARTLDSMFAASTRRPSRTSADALEPSQPQQSENNASPSQHTETMGAATETSVNASAAASAHRTNKVVVPESDCTLTSIRELRQEIQKHCHVALNDILQEHTFVGVVDIARSLSLIQHGTKLYLIDHDALIEEACYELTLRQFGSIQKTKLQPGVPLVDLLRLGLDLEAPRPETNDSSSGTDQEDLVGGLKREEAVAKISNHLCDRAQMLSEYFSLDIDVERGQLVGIPCLVPSKPPSTGTGPDMGAGTGTSASATSAGAEDSQASTHTTLFPLENLPSFLVRLGPQVDWTDEKECFRTFARELAWAHTLAQSMGEGQQDDQVAHNKDRLAHLVSHTWLPLLGSLCRRRTLHMPRSLVKEEKLIQLASLNDLYRIFERC